METLARHSYGRRRDPTTKNLNQIQEKYYREEVMNTPVPGRTWPNALTTTTHASLLIDLIKVWRVVALEIARFSTQGESRPTALRSHPHAYNSYEWTFPILLNLLQRTARTIKPKTPILSIFELLVARYWAHRHEQNDGAKLGYVTSAGEGLHFNPPIRCRDLSVPRSGKQHTAKRGAQQQHELQFPSSCCCD